MPTTPLIAVLTLVSLVGGWSVWPEQSAHPSVHPFWVGFLVAMPVGLAALVWRQQRWALMGCVIYGTVGLALDLATIVQILTKGSPDDGALLRSGISGVLNFLVIVLGGRLFLDVPQEPMPPGCRPPNPPSAGSSAAT